MPGIIITAIICGTVIALCIIGKKQDKSKYKAFYDYFMSLYGEGLEVANWHQNGDLEPLDNFIDSAIVAMRSKR